MLNIIINNQYNIQHLSMYYVRTIQRLIFLFFSVFFLYIFKIFFYFTISIFIYLKNIL